MKRWIKKAAAMALSLSILASTALASQVLQQNRLPLADSLALTGAYIDNGSTQKEHLLTYTPGGDVKPMVVFGDTLYGRSTMDTMESYVAEKGYMAVAAVNASFFDMKNGLPIGAVVTGGIVRSSGASTAVGVRKDGTLLLGEPNLEIRAKWSGEDRLLHYNKRLTADNGMVLYSGDYDDRTKGTLEGYHVILQAEEGILPLGSAVKTKVIQIVEKTKSCTIPENCFVLTLAEESPYEASQNAIRGLKVGTEVTLSATIDPAWSAVQDVVGAGDPLVEQGRILGSFTLDSANRQAPRTAIGIKANGDVVVYTVDRTETSAGMTLAELAQRMKDLGCVTAINMDGGGSTCVGVTQPGDTQFTTVNKPSDGTQRACANFLFFVRPVTPTGKAAGLYLYPYDAAVLPGGQVELTVKAADANYAAAKLPGAVAWSAEGGSVEGGVFTAGPAGTAVVTASSGGLTGSATVHVVETPSAMEILRQGQETPLESLLVECGTQMDLTVQAEYMGMALSARDDSFTWSVSESLGTISSDGVFTAAEKAATGTLTVTCGSLTVELPVEIRVNPFVDVKTNWAREPIAQLYFRGILKGAENAAGEMVYRPNDSMTRQEFIVALIRWLGVDASDYEKTELPFADQKKIASWAMEAMKAAYELGYLTGSENGGKLYAEPGATITREAAMTILARTQNALSESDALEDFSDADQISSWAVESLTAMVEQGVINGINGELQPKGNVTRGQVAKMLYAMGE